MHIHVLADELYCPDLVSKLKSLGYKVTCGPEAAEGATWVLQSNSLAMVFSQDVLEKLNDTLEKAHTKLRGSRSSA